MRSNSSKAELLASLPEPQRQAAIRSLANDEAEEILYDWRFWARGNQIQPAGDWAHWLLLAGRGFGKTRTGAETVREWASAPLGGPIHLVAPTAGDIRKVMVEGPGGLLSCYPTGQSPAYEPSKGHKITWPNGNVGYCFSADEPERLRGPQCCRYWADELAAWRFGQEAWDNLMMGFRLGDQLRGIITTTPKPTVLVKTLMASRAATVTRASTYDNRANLSPQFFETVVKPYEGTRLGRQELNAEILEDLPGALWKMAQIDAARITLSDVRWDLLVRVVVAVDPAVTSTEKSDETGIVVAALARSGHIVILDDLSLRGTPQEWGSAAVNAYLKYQADRIVGESNNGGDLVEGNIRAVNHNVSYRAVHASRGKMRRAEPVAALYEQGRVHHVGSFPDLEEQMCSYNPDAISDGKSKSPDRMDALVWAVTELVVDPEPARGVHILNPAGSYQISKY